MAEDGVENNNPVSEDHGRHSEASAIQAIDRKSVHRICSGQVVLTLGVAVKELVENSVDAGATSVEIKLKEYGRESIEVSDNGSGVEEKNFKGLTLKHHTSKLQDYSDLENVETFGFRGEALSSLCALSDLNVITCHSKASVGTKLEFDNHGNITSQSPCSRQTGTTVCLHNLFHTLPVRYKEFQRNLKKEFAKMVQVLNAYCVITTGVRILCSNQVGKGSRSVVVSTRGNSSVRENIVNIFGAKQLQQVLEFCQCRPSDEVCCEFGVKPDDESSAVFNISGFISKCEHGKGRCSTDRQFIFINRRPCDSTKIIKTVNEVYHMYNRHQYPFLVLNITMEKGTVDVNVTPDKRQIFLQGEKLLLAIIKTSLIKLLEPTTCMMTLNQHPSFRQSSDSPASVETSNPLSVLSRLKRSFSSAFSRSEAENTVIEKSPKKQRCLDQFVSRSPNNKANNHGKLSGDEVEVIVSPRLTKQNNTSDKVEDDNFNLSVEINKPENIDNIQQEKVTEMKSGLGNQKATETLIDGELNYDSNTDEPYQLFQETETDGSFIHESISSESLLHPDKRTDDSLLHPDELYNPHSVSNSILPSPDQMSDSHDKVGENNCELDTNIKPCCNNQQIQITELDKVREVKKREKTIKFSFEKLKLQKRKTELNENTNFCRSFRATISPTDNQSAEDELKREIKKEMFSQMEILGQFNLGFIIVKHGDDLFIVDQHATDEKYNFEVLQKNTVLQSQKLIQPQCLELTASNKTILADNLHIFTKNGFEFIVDEEAPPTQRIKLISTPVSKNWNFGKEDIEELIFMLTDSPGVMCRPSRVRMMFASRSCRKSVMIGTALNKSEMKKLICHMGEIVMPWNCPHGRPTIRHLFNLQMLPRT